MYAVPRNSAHAKKIAMADMAAKTSPRRRAALDFLRCEGCCGAGARGAMT